MLAILAESRAFLCTLLANLRATSWEYTRGDGNDYVYEILGIPQYSSIPFTTFIFTGATDGHWDRNG
jgi:hypothetical protein